MLSFWQPSRQPSFPCEGSELMLRALISIDSLSGMKAALPGLRTKLNTDPAYFKKVYMHTFDLVKAEGSRTLVLDTGQSGRFLRCPHLKLMNTCRTCSS